MIETHWSEALITPILIIATILLSPLPRLILINLRSNQKLNSRNEKENESSKSAAFIVPAQIHHARILPKESRHSFKYPSLYLTFELNQLEKGNCDCFGGFHWNSEQRSFFSKSYSLTKLNPKDFGRKTFSNLKCMETSKLLNKSILLKLIYELRFRDYLSVGPQDLTKDDLVTGSKPWNEEIGQVWAIAMPTVFGLAGFNPLTVYYVYKPSKDGNLSERGEFWMTILEVHNTFNERHIYVCEKGIGEDKSTEIRKGYDHSWTFARDFHVSPFNDRLGYYQLFLKDLWSNSQNSHLPTIDIRLLLLVPPEGGDDNSSTNASLPLQKKLLATLTSSQSTSATQKTNRIAKPLSTINIYSLIWKQPFDLFLPVARIMWQAAKLHWKKRLPVHIRPEPKGEAKMADGNFLTSSSSTLSAYDGLGWPNVHNPVELGSADGNQIRSRASGDIYWNDESFIEKICRNQIEKWFCSKTRQSSSVIQIKNKNPEMDDMICQNGQIDRKDKDSQPDNENDLTFYTMSSALYLDLCLYIPEHAFLFGCQVERGWGVNSIENYKAFFSDDKNIQSVNSSRSVRIARWLRSSYIRWATNDALENENPKLRQEKQIIANRLINQSLSIHFLDVFGYSWTLLLAMALHIYTLKLMAKASKMLNVRYVRHPWAQVGEGLAILSTQSHFNDNSGKSDTLHLKI